MSAKSLMRGLVAASTVLLTTTVVAQHVTGQWDFENPADGLAATVGSDGYIWTRPTITPPTDIRTATEFDTVAGFGITAFPGGGDGGVMKFPTCDQYMGYKMFTNTPANGGGVYVNQYTLIFDVLYPASSNSVWRTWLQTNECNTNDQDLALNPANGIGISGNYSGTISPDTWHRVAFSLDLTTSTLGKYIDGVLVGSQTLGEGVDGRWALYGDGDGLPALLFADNDGDSREGYCSSVQFRNYAMSAAEIAALGGVSSSNIPGGTGVTGQWDFENAADGLSATTGLDLDWFDGNGCFGETCTQNLLADTQFGLSSDWGIPNLPDGPTGVMYWALCQPCTGYLLPHGAEANGGGLRVNDYTVIFDVYIRSDDYFDPAANTDWIVYYQSSPLNNEDAMLWTNKQGASLGDDGGYAGTDFWCLEDRWMRIVAAVNGSDPTGTKITKYVLYTDDSMVGPATQDEGPDEPVDGKRSLVTNESTWGVDHFLAFTDDDFEVTRGHVSSIQIRDYVMSTEEVLALGGPRAAGIPGAPANCPGDVDGDNDVDLTDLATLLANFGTASGATRAQGDLDGDTDVDLTDLATLLANFGTSC